MALLITLFLVLINIFNNITTNSPKAEGLTAIEIWMLACILFVFGKQNKNIRNYVYRLRIVYIDIFLSCLSTNFLSGCEKTFSFLLWTISCRPWINVLKSLSSLRNQPSFLFPTFVDLWNLALLTLPLSWWPPKKFSILWGLVLKYMKIDDNILRQRMNLDYHSLIIQ